MFGIYCTHCISVSCIGDCVGLMMNYYNLCDVRKLFHTLIQAWRRISVFK